MHVDIHIIMKKLHHNLRGRRYFFFIGFIDKNTCRKLFSEIINWWMCPYECPNIWDRLRVLWFSGTVNCTRIIHARTMQARWQPKLIADKNFANKLNEISSAYFRPSFASTFSSSFFLWLWSFLFFYSNSFYLYNYKSATILCSNKKKRTKDKCAKKDRTNRRSDRRDIVLRAE